MLVVTDGVVETVPDGIEVVTLGELDDSVVTLGAPICMKRIRKNSN